MRAVRPPRFIKTFERRWKTRLLCCCVSDKFDITKVVYYTSDVLQIYTVYFYLCLAKVFFITVPVKRF